MDGPCLHILQLKSQKKMSDLEKAIVIISVYNFGPDGVSITTTTVNKYNPVYNLKMPHIKTVHEMAVSIKEKYAQRRANCILFVFYD